LRGGISSSNHAEISRLALTGASRIGGRHVAAQSPSAAIVTAPSRCRRPARRRRRSARGSRTPASFRWLRVKWELSARGDRSGSRSELTRDDQACREPLRAELARAKCAHWLPGKGHPGGAFRRTAADSDGLALDEKRTDG